MRHLAMLVLIAAVSSCGAGCGDDDTGSNPSTPLRDGGNGSRVDGGMGPSGPGDEGAGCVSDGNCNGGFKCVANVFTIGICARACSTEANCDDGERCFSYTGQDSDKHCVNIVDEEFGLCGVGYTSLCGEKRVCLYAEGLPIGICVGLCDLDGPTLADAGVDDGGVIAEPATAGHVLCGSTQTCVDDVLREPDPNEGVCGMYVDRGELCGTERGLFCATADVCVPDDINDSNSEWRCRQDCSTGQTCEQGKCMPVPNFATYCQ
jgi:hypothetical protein